MPKSVMLLSLFLAGCGLISGDGAPFQVIDNSYRPLSSDFNEDMDYVRIVMLASPT